MTSMNEWRQLETDYFKTHGNVENKSNSPFNFLTTICDHKVYTWNMTSQSIVVADYSELVNEKSKVNAQVYRVKRVVKFSPMHLDVKSHNGVYCLLWGNKGAALIQLPAVAFQSDRMKSSSVFLGEKIHVAFSKLNVLSAKLAADKLKRIAAILYDDKFIRIYDVVDGNVLEVICGSNHYQSPLNMDVKLDATPHGNPVDFDFGPIWPKSKFWPLYILLDTGDIQYFLVRILDNSKECITQEFRRITNDLGLDWKAGERATGITCISHTYVVVASNTGHIFYSVLIPNASNRNNNYSPKSLELRESGIEFGEHDDGQATSKDSSTHKLYNLETKMMESQMIYLKVGSISTKSKDLKHLSFTKLIKDPLHEHRLMCIHDYGALIITVPSAEQFSRFMKNFPTKWSQPSIRYLLKWSLNQGSVQGVAFSDSMPQSLLFVRGDSQSSTHGLPSLVDNQPLIVTIDLETSSSCLNADVHLKGSEEILERNGERTNKVEEARGHNSSAISSSKEVTISNNEVSTLADTFTDAVIERSAAMSAMLLKRVEGHSLLKAHAVLLTKNYDEKLEGRGLRLLPNPLYTENAGHLTNLKNIGDDIIDLQGLVKGLKRKMSVLDPPCSLPNKVRLTPSQLKLIKEELQVQHQALRQLTQDVHQIMENTSWQTDSTTNQQ